MCAPDPPPAPDLVGAAEQQGEANIEAAQSTAKINNPNIYSPYGTQITTFDEGFQPTVTQTFSPEQQALFDTSTAVKQELGDVGLQSAQTLQNILGTSVNFDDAPKVGNYDETRGKVYDAMMTRVNQDVTRDREQKSADLIAAGIRPGTEAFSREMESFDRRLNDASYQAQIAAGQEASRAFGMDSEARKQFIAELLSQRQMPLNEISALMSGSQVVNPFAGGLGYQGGASVAAAPIFAGQQAQYQSGMDAYNADVASQNAMMSGLFSLGSAGIGLF